MPSTLDHVYHLVNSKFAILCIKHAIFFSFLGHQWSHGYEYMTSSASISRYPVKSMCTCFFHWVSLSLYSIAIAAGLVKRPNFAYSVFCSQAGAGLRVLTPASGGSLRDAPWCPTLDTALTRRPGTTFPTSSRSLLYTMSLSLSCLWCTTDDFFFSSAFWKLTSEHSGLWCTILWFYIIIIQ